MAPGKAMEGENYPCTDMVIDEGEIPTGSHFNSQCQHNGRMDKIYILTLSPSGSEI